MAEPDILPGEETGELLDGQIYLVSPIGSEHASCVDRLPRLFVLGAGDDAIVRVQNPVRLSEISEPEPNLALLASREDDYTKRHPHPDDVFLIIEVADSSLDFDRETKRLLYAEAGIPELRIVALEYNRVHVCRSPEADLYAEHEMYGPEKDVPVTTLSSLVPVSADLILGR